MKKLFSIKKKSVLKTIRGFFSVCHSYIFKQTTKKQLRFHKKIALLLLFVIIVGVIAPIGINTASAGLLDDVATGVTEYLGIGLDVVVGGLANLVAKAINAGANKIMVFGAFLLDESLIYSIQSQHFKFTGIQNAWKVFRDVANMTFIFILLYIAFATILQLGGGYKRMLVTLIIIALLINFSFFFTGIVIDTSNILALFLYNIITDGGTLSISEQLANKMEIDSLFDPATFKTLSFTKNAMATMLAAIFFLFAFFIFLSAAILFVLRTIVLMFVLILAPLAFAAVILPATKSNFNKWLHHLINYSFVAPVYLLGILVVLIIIPGMFSLSGADKVSLARGDFITGTGSFQIFLGFILVFGLMAGVLAISRSMADKIGGLSVKYAGKITGLAAGAAAWGTRKTVGAAARAARDSETLQKLARSDHIATRYASRAAIRTADYGARSSFDARRGLQGGLGAAGIKTNLGKPSGKGGYEADLKIRDERRAKTAKLLKDGAAKKAYAEDVYARSKRGIIEQHGPSAQIQTESEKLKRRTTKTEASEKLVESFRKTQQTSDEENLILSAIKKATEETASKESPAPETKSETKNS